LIPLKKSGNGPDAPYIELFLKWLDQLMLVYYKDNNV